MMKVLILVVVAITVFLAGLDFYTSTDMTQREKKNLSIRKQFKFLEVTPLELKKIQSLLQKSGTNLNRDVIRQVITTLKCAKKVDLKHNNILTIIDYSLPANEKRLWVFDMTKMKLLFHTYVSHAIKSGLIRSTFFSNKVNSKHSSIGVYSTDNSYYGRYGLSLKLHGLDKNINDNAYRRFIVMHGAWYMSESFIKKYGRPGRSWGCPALPQKLTKPIIDTIKNNALFIVYYPSKYWNAKSKFLNCENLLSKQKPQKNDIKANHSPSQRDYIVFIDKNNNDRRDMEDPIVVIDANSYTKLFNKRVKLRRVLRRQIDETEYIALSREEFNFIVNNQKMHRSKIKFVIPFIKKKRGYYATEFRMVSPGVIINIKKNKTSSPENYTLILNNNSSMTLKVTNRFIRWLGL